MDICTILHKYIFLHRVYQSPKLSFHSGTWHHLSGIEIKFADPNKETCVGLNWLRFLLKLISETIWLYSLKTTYVNRHIEIVQFELISHFTVTLQSVFSFGLLKPVGLLLFAALLQCRTEMLLKLHLATMNQVIHFVKSKYISLVRTVIYLCYTSWAPPVTFRYLLYGWYQAVGMICIVASVTK